MAIDDATLEKLKKLDDKKKIKKLLEKIRPDLEKRFKDKKDKRKNLPDDFLDKFKKSIPEVTPEEDKKNTPIIPKDFFKNKRFNPDKMPSPYKGPFKPRPDMSPEEKRKYFMELANENPNKKGGEVKRYKAGGSVKKNKSNMITTKGWGASRKT